MKFCYNLQSSEEKGGPMVLSDDEIISQFITWLRGFSEWEFRFPEKFIVLCLNEISQDASVNRVNSQRIVEALQQVTPDSDSMFTTRILRQIQVEESDPQRREAIASSYLRFRVALALVDWEVMTIRGVKMFFPLINAIIPTLDVRELHRMDNSLVITLWNASQKHEGRVFVSLLDNVAGLIPGSQELARSIDNMIARLDQALTRAAEMGDLTTLLNAAETEAEAATYSYYFQIVPRFKELKELLSQIRSRMTVEDSD